MASKHLTNFFFQIMPSNIKHDVKTDFSSPEIKPPIISQVCGEHFNQRQPFIKIVPTKNQKLYFHLEHPLAAMFDLALIELHDCVQNLAKFEI